MVWQLTLHFLISRIRILHEVQVILFIEWKEFSRLIISLIQMLHCKHLFMLVHYYFWWIVFPIVRDHKFSSSNESRCQSTFTYTCISIYEEYSLIHEFFQIIPGILNSCGNLEQIFVPFLRLSFITNCFIEDMDMMLVWNIVNPVDSLREFDVANWFMFDSLKC